MNVDNECKVVDFHFGEAFVAQYAGVIDQYVDATKSVHGLADHIGDASIISNR